MLKLRVKASSQKKFVQNYMGIVKEVEKVLDSEVRVDSTFETMVVELKIKAPFFNYVLSQKNHRGELVSVSMNLMRQNRDHSY